MSRQEEFDKAKKRGSFGEDIFERYLQFKGLKYRRVSDDKSEWKKDIDFYVTKKNGEGEIAIDVKTDDWVGGFTPYGQWMGLRPKPMTNNIMFERYSWTNGHRNNDKHSDGCNVKSQANAFVVFSDDKRMFYIYDKEEFKNYVLGNPDIFIPEVGKPYWKRTMVYEAESEGWMIPIPMLKKNIRLIEKPIPEEIQWR